LMDCYLQLSPNWACPISISISRSISLYYYKWNISPVFPALSVVSIVKPLKPSSVVAFRPFPPRRGGSIRYLGRSPRVSFPSSFIPVPPLQGRLYQITGTKSQHSFVFVRPSRRPSGHLRYIFLSPQTRQSLSPVHIKPSPPWGIPHSTPVGVDLSNQLGPSPRVFRLSISVYSSRSIFQHSSQMS